MRNLSIVDKCISLFFNYFISSLNEAIQRIPGYPFFSYHRTEDGLVIVGNPDTHVKSLE